MKDGVNITNKVYHSRGELGSSSARAILENPRRWRYKEWGSTPAMRIGDYGHNLVLERDSSEFIITDLFPEESIIEISENYNIEDIKIYPQEVITPKGNLSTSQENLIKIKELEEGKYLTPKDYLKLQFYLENIDKKFIKISEAKISEKVAKKINDLYYLDFEFTHNELSFFGELDGTKVKCRPDAIQVIDEERKIIGVIDLKITGFEATAKEFESSVSKYNYHIQEAWYRLVLESLGYKIKYFHFMVASTLKYSGVEIFTIPRDLVEAGKDACFKAIEKYRYCILNEEWKEGKFDGEFHKVTEIKPALHLYDRF